MSVNVFNFNNWREFNKKFPSKLYVCSACGSLTDNPYFCNNCQNQANNLFHRSNNFAFKIGDEKEKQIFSPIEINKTEFTS